MCVCKGWWDGGRTTEAGWRAHDGVWTHPETPWREVAAHQSRDNVSATTRHCADRSARVFFHSLSQLRVWSSTVQDVETHTGLDGCDETLLLCFSHFLKMRACAHFSSIEACERPEAHQSQ